MTSPETPELNPELKGSEQITKSSNSNLALAFMLLPKERRSGMVTFYAFCRVVDDIADSETLPVPDKRRMLTEWHEEIDRIYSEKKAQTALGQELGQVIKTYGVEQEPLVDVIRGVEMDLEKSRYGTFEELDLYCYRVASAVGLVSISIFGCIHPQSKEYAVALGKALQLTNILRDVRKDAELGRIYLPAEELESFGVNSDQIMEGAWSEQIRQLLRFQHHRARHYFAKAHRLLPKQDRIALITAEGMRETYEAILNEIERRNFDIIRTPFIKLSKWSKARLMFRSWRNGKKPFNRPPRPKNVVVLGAGWAGLAASAELIRLGHRVTLVESRAVLGGRAHSFVDTKTGQVLDNGQHVLMGCYHETLKLVRHLGSEQKLYTPPTMDVPFLSPRGHSSLTAHWPAPFHLLSALLHFSELTTGDKWAASRLMIGLRMGRYPGPKETVTEWLNSWHQSHNIVRALWEPLCVAALNEPCQTASATLFATVVERSFLGGTEDSKILLSRVGLSHLFADECARLLHMCQGTLRAQEPVQGLHFQCDRIDSVQLTSGEKLQADAVVSALPWHVVRSFLPQDQPLTGKLRSIGDSPIVSLHLWFDRAIFKEPFIGFIDSPLHWLFNREHIHTGENNQHGHVVTVVYSGARDLIDMPAEKLEALTLSEIHRFLPDSKQASVLHRRLYKARSATFAATPSAEPFRPTAETPWKNFFLAGDWTATGLPATLESAVQSGFHAAQVLDKQVLN